jgi:hypothetical protein
MYVKTTTDRGATDYWRFQWLRHKGRYEIVWKPPIFAADLLVRYPDLKFPFLNLTASAPPEVYCPLEDAPGISREFARLQNVDSVLQFANTYGLLGLEEVRRMHAHKKEIEKAGENVNLWIEEAAKLARQYSVWDLVNSDATGELRKIIRWHGRNAVTVRFPDTEQVIADQLRNASWVKKWKPGEVIGPAKLYLIEQFNQNMLNMASPMLLLNAKEQMRPHNSPSSLLGAIWLEFGQIASGARRHVSCESCGKVMDVTGLRSDKRKHSNCVLREKMARYRNAKREMEDGKTKTRKR